jgi:RimJ/RimL family protein N-acetyltransferase
MIELNNFAHAEEIAKGAGIVTNPSVDMCISRSKNGKFLGGTIYKDYTGVSLSLHIFAVNKSWINKDLLWVSFHYPFEQLGCKKIFAPVPNDNTYCIEFCQKIGFKLDTIIRDVFPSGDMHILSMYKEECHWLNLEPRKIQIGAHTDGR